MAKVLIIGAGGVGNVVAKKCAQNDSVFTDIMIASRTKSKCDKIAAEIKKYFPKSKTKVSTAKVDADNVPELVKLIKKYKPAMVINVALALSRFNHHGCLPRDWDSLLRHRQLRTQRCGQV